jgi:hypothetical protein
MKRVMFRSVLVLGLVAGWLMSGSSLAAQEGAKQGLPKAEDILDREVEAMGGKAAFQKLKTHVMKGKITINNEVEGRIVQYRAVNKYYAEFAIDGLFNLEKGVIGDVAWENNSIAGYSLLKDAERAKAVRDADMLAAVNWRKHYLKVKTVGEEMVADKAAYKVQMTTPEGETMLSHFDKQTGLLVRQEVVIDTPEGQVTLVTFPSDYKKVNGIVYPFTSKIVDGSTELVLTVDQIEHNVDIPEGRFALPAEVKKLLEKQKKQ